MKIKYPPLEISPTILTLCSEISLLVGRLEGVQRAPPEPMLRRTHRIKTIQGSLAIEGNTLSIEQISAILEGKKVLGPKKDILEVQNANKAYEIADQLNPTSIRDFLKAHKILMNNLVSNVGHWRTSGVGILKGAKVKHIAPPANLVLKNMERLFVFLKEKNDEIPLLVKSAAFHYELEFIHPFSDGNGRMGRFWQHVILLKQSPVFGFVPVESVIKDRQKEYYKVLEKADRSGDVTHFVEFSLKALFDALKEMSETIRFEPLTSNSRLESAKIHFSTLWFVRKDYINLFKSIATATASRDLAEGVAKGLLLREGDKARARYRFSE